ncbi:TIGR01244 family sulfur transferase [Aurantiacibacter hainanensis]|uniref:TIGR01244 family sulfur transferase n=1 Tax=Aurantiacibacter hainanensis TaxID=3076114 RepID=UPI0030C6DBB5
MSDFRQLSDSMWASPQIGTGDVSKAADEGFSLVINNRPDGEEEGQPAGSVIESAAKESGLAYMAIPVGHSGFRETQVEAMAGALAEADGKVLAYCRSGTRSTFLWALARASQGADPAELARAAQGAGYDISPIIPMLDILAAKAGH